MQEWLQEEMHNFEQDEIEAQERFGDLPKEREVHTPSSTQKPHMESDHQEGVKEAGAPKGKK
jgi:hypothetical protein